MKLLTSFLNLIAPKSVDRALAGVQKAIDQLDAAAEHAVSSKDIIKGAIVDLSNEWDKHNEDHRRAVAVSTKLKDLIS
ncbi:hypothetical protein [Luteibacter sp. 22Crub2.1]|uniref:hypothetical protein n=1 Tax=Luteibacter sp. 22Crub2.1 TaxID=1283288 RepID=UPI0009A6CB1E|nr:hypothetical protein [Luteibacter sp. 22Crub2.1]SKB50438.1 hypothetical protein SAMN05660880_01350 [Luteibacter sp. 22Crub2.1]